jgi:hypothetical protein
MRGDRTAALVRACHRGIREFCLSAARVYLCDKRAVDHVRLAAGLR